MSSLDYLNVECMNLIDWFAHSVIRLMFLSGFLPSFHQFCALHEQKCDKNVKNSTDLGTCVFVFLPFVFVFFFTIFVIPTLTPFVFLVILISVCIQARRECARVRQYIPFWSSVCVRSVCGICRWHKERGFHSSADVHVLWMQMMWASSREEIITSDLASLSEKGWPKSARRSFQCIRVLSSLSCNRVVELSK